MVDRMGSGEENEFFGFVGVGSKSVLENDDANKRVLAEFVDVDAEGVVKDGEFNYRRVQVRRLVAFDPNAWDHWLHRQLVDEPKGWTRLMSDGDYFILQGLSYSIAVLSGEGLSGELRVIVIDSLLADIEKWGGASVLI